MEKHETVTRTHGVIHNSPLHMNIYIYVHIRVCQQTASVLLYGSENWTKKARLNIESEMPKFNLTLTAKYTWTVAQENLNNTN